MKDVPKILGTLGLCPLVMGAWMICRNKILPTCLNVLILVIPGQTI